ncbi:hypothetical protein IAU60_002309 [Kwoniella sp. DSM 27419]
MPPPPIPPKDYHSSRSSLLSPPTYISPSSSNNSFINQDLAEAVRDSVQIKTKPPRPASTSYTRQQQAHDASQQTNLLDISDLANNNNNNNTGVNTNGRTNGPPPPSLAPLVPRRTPSPHLPAEAMSTATAPAQSAFQPTHRYSPSSPDMSSLSIGQQPALPSARMSQLAPRNPFEEDDTEPPAGRIRPPGMGHNHNKSSGAISTEGDGVIQPNRSKFVRSHTGAAASTSSSAGLLGATSPTVPKGKTRRSMSSDSYGFVQDTGPIKELTAGQKKALEDKKGSRHADVIDTWDPTGLGSAMWHHAGPYDAAAPSRNTNLPPAKAPMQAFNGPAVQSPPRTGPTTISLSSPPVVPPKDETSEKPAHRRGTSGARAVNTRRVSGGGLTGQYSTSMPSSGGYFPNMEEPMDEAAIMRRERQREREAKRQALKAAWGTDTPEPFEDFGGSPHEGMVDITEDDVYSPEMTSAPLPGKPARSPGLRFGLGPASPSIKEGEVTSPLGENSPVLRGNGANATGAGGVKRTKSLMQKIKTMRESQGHAGRSSSPRGFGSSDSSTANGNMNGTGTGTYAGSPSSEFPPGSEDRKKPGFFTRTSGRNSPKKSGSGTPGATAPALSQGDSGVAITTTSPDTEADIKLDMEDVALEHMALPTVSSNGYALVESPSSKARALRALRKEQEDARSTSTTTAASAPAPARPKNLPTPPIAPVMPDFNDIVPPPRKNSPLEVPGDAHDGLKRKTSMVKKLRERIAK